MNDTPRYVKEVQRILADFESDDNQGTTPDTTTPENIIDMYIEDFAEEERITLIRKKPPMPATSDDERDLPDLDTAPLQPQPAPTGGSGILPFGLFLTLLCLICVAVQLDFIINPFSVTVTLAARSQQIALQGTLQLGRLLNPITISQSATAPTTGHGHQDAKAATGFITFYNGQLQSITVPAGTLLTGSDGVEIITDQDANIPAANLPQVSQVTVNAHALNAGANGNIPANDINQGCCNGVKAVNLHPFSGGQDERDYTYVQKSDIASAADPLKATVSQGVQGAIQGQVKASESFATPSCETTTTSDHQPGDEAGEVKVTVSETCSAVAYNDQELTSSVTQLLTKEAAKKVGSGYGLLDTPQITVTSVSGSGKKVTFSFKTISTWVYGISSAQQQTMKRLIAGKNTQEALKVLRSLPGIESASVAFSGFGDSSRIPKTIANIHILMFVA